MRSKREFTVIIERDEDGWYMARVPALRGCHTQAKNLDALMKRTREAIQVCLERKRRILIEAEKLNPKEERALAEG